MRRIPDLAEATAKEAGSDRSRATETRRRIVKVLADYIYEQLREEERRAASRKLDP